MCTMVFRMPQGVTEGWPDTHVNDASLELFHSLLDRPAQFMIEVCAPAELADCFVIYLARHMRCLMAGSSGIPGVAGGIGWQIVLCTTSEARLGGLNGRMARRQPASCVQCLVFPHS